MNLLVKTHANASQRVTHVPSSMEPAAVVEGRLKLEDVCPAMKQGIKNHLEQNTPQKEIAIMVTPLYLVIGSLI